jgi:hypothetical protein
MKVFLGPFFEDRNNNHWFMAAGDDGITEYNNSVLSLV